MGNCQAADVAQALVIQHPDGRTELSRQWPLPASRVMAANPGHYVAVVITAAPRPPPAGARPPAPVRYLMLLRPDEELLVGRFYRLVTFEEVLREFGTKRRVRLSRFLGKQKERGGGGGDRRSTTESEERTVTMEEQQQAGQEDNLAIESAIRRSTNGSVRYGQWRPSLHTIAEIGS